MYEFYQEYSNLNKDTVQSEQKLEFSDILYKFETCV